MGGSATVRIPSFGSRRFVVGVVSGGHFLSHLYVLAFPPLFPLLSAEFGLSNFQLGLIPGAIFFAPMVLQLPVGEIADRVGAKRVFVIGLILTSVSVMSISLAPSYHVLLVLALVSGIGQSAFHPADLALIDAVSDRDTRGKGFGLHAFGGFAGLAVAPIVVGGLASVYGWRIALILVGSVGVLYALGTQATMEPIMGVGSADVEDGSPDSDGETALRDLATKRALATFVLFVASTMALAGFETFTPVFVIDSFAGSGSDGNRALTVFLSSLAVGVLVGGVFADRTNDSVLIGASFAVGGVLTGIAVTIGSGWGLWTVGAVFALVGFANGFAFPARDNLVSAIGNEGGAGRSFGFVYTGVSIGLFASPILLGFVIDQAGTGTALLIIGAFYLAAAAVAVEIGIGR